MLWQSSELDGCNTRPVRMIAIAFTCDPVHPGLPSRGIFSRPFGTGPSFSSHPGLRPGLFSARAVQISCLVDSGVLILLDKRMPRPGLGNQVGVSEAEDLRCVLSKLLR